MEQLQDEQLYSLVTLINNYFEFEIEYCINSDFFDENFLGDEFAGYSFKCTDSDTSQFLIELTQKLKAKEQNSTLEQFKHLF